MNTSPFTTSISFILLYSTEINNEKCSPALRYHRNDVDSKNSFAFGRTYGEHISWAKKHVESEERSVLMGNNLHPLLLHVSAEFFISFSLWSLWKLKLVFLRFSVGVSFVSFDFHFAERGHTTLKCNRYVDMQRDTSALTDERMASYREFERELNEAEDRQRRKHEMEKMYQQPAFWLSRSLHQQPKQPTKPQSFWTSRSYGQSVYRFCFGGKQNGWLRIFHAPEVTITVFSGNKFAFKPNVFFCDFYCSVSIYQHFCGTDSVDFCTGRNRQVNTVSWLDFCLFFVKDKQRLKFSLFSRVLFVASLFSAYFRYINQVGDRHLLQLLARDQFVCAQKSKKMAGIYILRVFAIDKWR